ncbi:hypothetical protein [Nocardiopsis ganjiahuensis]|uniref:hypothetical protein n=1 Tax=Nocardiopsis ganjiahuensis TaxID=239984 RepID=UPI000349815A|nr:hypothetical protein [Nocardiopsis ganjiahuensis]
MLDIIRLLLLTAHLFGMAAVVGTFFVQMRHRSGFSTNLVLGGAIVQVATGIALVGARYASDLEVNHVKIAVKIGIGGAVLVAAVLAARAQRGQGRVKPLFHTAGGLATVNVLVAALWQ